MLEHARLGVGSIQHGHLRGRNPVVDEAFHDVDDERRLVSVRWRDERAHRLALRVGGPQILAQPTLVMPDQRIRRVENVTVRAVVLLELDQLYRRFGRGEVALEVLHVGDARTPKRVDRLVVIADREHCGVRTGQQPDPAVLQRVGVLELVDQQVREAPTIVLPQRFMSRQQFEAAQQELGKIDHAFAAARLFVEREVLDLTAREVVIRLDLIRPRACLLRAVDQRLQLARGKALIVDAARLVHPFDQRQLVLHVHDLEQLGQPRIAIVGAKHAVAQAVKGADPHAARVDRRQRGEPGEHLPGCLVGEGHREHRGRACLTCRQQPGDPRREHARLAAAGAGENQCRTVRQGYRSELFGVEIG